MIKALESRIIGLENGRCMELGSLPLKRLLYTADLLRSNLQMRLEETVSWEEIWFLESMLELLEEGTELHTTTRGILKHYEERDGKVEVRADSVP